jgi:ATP-binding cassette, subfamily B, bacterial
MPRPAAERTSPRQAVRAISMLAAAAFSADKLRASLVLAIAPVAGVTTAVIGIGTRDMINAAIDHDEGATLAAAALLAGAVVVGFLAGTIAADVRIRLQQRVGLLLDQRIVEMCAGVPYLDHHESPAYLDKMELLRAHRGELGGAFGSLVENLRSITGFAATLGLLMSVRPAFALLLLAALPTVMAVRRGGRKVAQVERATVSLERQRRGLYTLACSPEAAKELLVYGLQEEIAALHGNLQARVNRPRRRASTQAATWTVAGWLIFGAGFVTALSVIVDAASHGHASPGDVMLTVVLGSQLSGNVSSLVAMISWLQSSVRSAGYYLWLADYAKLIGYPSPARVAALSVPSAPADGGDLVLDRVSFGYPGGGAQVLHEVSLRVPAGRTLAIVGENGAGKTTLVKLLCRMYAPTGGHISYAGTDLADYDLVRWRGGLTACFQDFCKLQFLLREAVGVGDLPGIGDDAAVTAALDGAGAGHLAGLLPRRLETQLGISFPGGTDLSGGQWQKLAVARAGMRSAPVLRILDEPAASLDPASEYEVFERYRAVAREAADDSITVFVSHRFATVRMADLIIVLDGGRVCEQGSHAELMAAGGLYATLYELHARGYVSGSTVSQGSL